MCHRSRPYTQIRVYPFSFGEFYAYVGGDERKALEQYMLYGGMPRVLQMTDEQDKKDYLSTLYSELYVKDIVERNGIEREDILNNILDFLASQISSLTNPTNVANAIASIQQQISQQITPFKSVTQMQRSNCGGSIPTSGSLPTGLFQLSPDV